MKTASNALINSNVTNEKQTDFYAEREAKRKENRDLL